MNLVPFSKGACRFAYAAAVNLGDATESNRCLLHCVIKESVFLEPVYNTRVYYEESIQIQAIASYLAHRFSKVYKNRKTEIRFLDVDLVRIHETGVYYSIEEFVEGKRISTKLYIHSND